MGKKKEKTVLKVSKEGIRISGPEVEIETDGSIAKNVVDAGILIADSLKGDSVIPSEEKQKKDRRVVVAGKQDADA